MARRIEVAKEIDTVVLDIEGTVCPISFVKETLFPYALRSLPTYLSTNWDTPSFKKDYLSLFPPSTTTSPETLTAHIHALTAADVKDPGLKALQGALWRSGYESGEIATPLFDDVRPVLENWKNEDGKQLAVFSSGSVAAQKLFFAHVGAAQPPMVKGSGETEEEGKRGGSRDLTPLFSGFFDTVSAGPKVTAGSYDVIARALGRDAKQLLFLTDNVREVEAAAAAGWVTLVVDRPGNAVVTEEERGRWGVVESLDEIVFV